MFAGPMLRHSRRENAVSRGDFGWAPFCAPFWAKPPAAKASKQIARRAKRKRMMFLLIRVLSVVVWGAIMTFPQTDRTRLKRLSKRGHFDRETVYGILDE